MSTSPTKVTQLSTYNAIVFTRKTCQKLLTRESRFQESWDRKIACPSPCFTLVKHKKEEIAPLGRGKETRSCKIFSPERKYFSFNVSKVTLTTVATLDILLLVRIFFVYVELKYCATSNMETLSGVADEGINA